VSTLPHLNAWQPRFEAEGVDVKAAIERGQMTASMKLEDLYDQRVARKDGVATLSSSWRRGRFV